MTVTLGIDLGTRYAQTAVCLDGKGVVPVPNRWGNFRTPSVVGWTNAGWRAGEEAAREEMRNPRSTWWDIKRHVASSWRARCGTRSLPAEELLVPLLTLLREDGEIFLGTLISRCILTVPSSFTFAARSAMSGAACKGGFTSVRIVNEPVAAALAFGFPGRFLVLDWGGGTVDLAVVEREGGVWQVLESEGLAFPGGRDLDCAMADLLAAKTAVPRPGEDTPEGRILLHEGEEVKIALSGCSSFEWHPPAGLGGSPVAVTRREFEARIAPLLEDAVSRARALWRAWNPSRLLFIGGSSRIPFLRRVVEERVARPEHLSLSPDEAVAAGAALWGGMKGEGNLLLDVLSSSLGIYSARGDQVILLEKGSPIPARAEKKFVAVGRGSFPLKIFQGSGPGAKILSRVIVPEGRREEEVTLSFSVDPSGLLSVLLKRLSGAVPLPLLQVEEAGETLRKEKPEEISLLERRFALLSPSLPPSLEERGTSLFRTLRLLSRGDKYPEALRALDRMLCEMERIVG